MRNVKFNLLRLPFLMLFLVPLSWSVPSSAQDNSDYDAKLAEELGGDEYGMRSYVFVTLKTGPANITDEAQ